MIQTHYTATSLDDIAQTFVTRAEECERQAGACRAQKHADHYRAQAGVWSTAAELLRMTKLEPRADL